MRNTHRKMALSSLGTLIEVLASCQCSRFSCIGIRNSVETQKDCSIVPLPVFLGMVQWAETGLHAHILSWFKGHIRHRMQSTPADLGLVLLGAKLPILWHSKVQQGKSGKEIIPLDCRHEHHGCLWMPLSSCAVTGEKEALLEHSSAPPEADAWIPTLSVVWLRAAPGQGAQIWCVHRLY